MKDTKCPYCGGKVLFSKTSDIIYGKNYSAIYYCEHYPKCDAYVGTHKGTTKSLGRLANKELREKKKNAHYYFDYLWRAKRKRGFRNARNLGYKWLSKELNILQDKTHIGMFDEETCQRVIDLCKPYVENLKRKGE